MQVNQLGFAPRDPAKVAFLSASLAGQQAVGYSGRPEFEVIEAKTGKVKQSGRTVKRQVGCRRGVQPR